MSGYGVEMMFEYLLSEAGFAPDREFFTRKVALQTMQHYPYGVERVLKTYRGITQAGYNPQKINKTQFQDWVMGIGFVVEVCHFDTIHNVAIDVTANPTEVDDKVNHLNRSQPFLKELGIDHCAVVYFSYNGDEGWQMLPDSVKSGFVDQLFRQITFDEWSTVINIL